MTAIVFALLFMIFPVDESKPLKTENNKSNAFDIETKEFLYKEEHLIEINASKIIKSTTEYIDKQGQLRAKRVLKYGEDLTKPDFRIDHYNIEYHEGAKRIDTNVVRVFRGNNNETEQLDLILNDDFVIDAGLNHYFAKHWENLLNGEELNFYFITPSQLDYFNFRVYKNDIVTINGKEGMELIVEPNSFFLRLFFSSIYVTYALDTKEILFYKGISNIYDNNAEIYDVIIDYTMEGIK